MVVVPQISLLITKAEVESLEFTKNYKEEWQFRVSIQLYAGIKPVTRMYLRSDTDFDDINYIEFDDKTRGVVERLLKYVGENANISLTKLSKQIKEAEEVVNG